MTRDGPEMNRPTLFLKHDLCTSPEYFPLKLSRKVKRLLWCDMNLIRLIDSIFMALEILFVSTWDVLSVFQKVQGDMKRSYVHKTVSGSYQLWLRLSTKYYRVVNSIAMLEKSHVRFLCGNVWVPTTTSEIYRMKRWIVQTFISKCHSLTRGLWSFS